MGGTIPGMAGDLPGAGAGDGIVRHGDGTGDGIARGDRIDPGDLATDLAMDRHQDPWLHTALEAEHPSADDTTHRTTLT